MPAALISHGYEVLRDARTTVRIRGEQLDLVGVRFWTRRARDIARLIRGAESTVILLAHDPRRLDEAAALNVPLVLSGHTHGGQVVLPGLGAIAAKKFPVVAGVGRRENTSIFVSRGVGTVYVPYRLNCPPDVSVITLKDERVKRVGRGFACSPANPFRPCRYRGDQPPSFDPPSAIQQQLNGERIEMVLAAPEFALRACRHRHHPSRAQVPAERSGRHRVRS